MSDPDKRSRTSKYVIRTVAVITAVLFVYGAVWFMQYFLCIPGSFDDNRVLMLHKEPDDTIDVLFVGSSATYADYSAAYAYEKYGFTSYPFAISGASCTNWKPALRDALRSQKPKLVVVDVYGACYVPETIRTRSSQTYTIMSHQPVTLQKIETAKEVSAEVEQTSTASLVMPFLKFHYRVPSNLKDIKKRMAAESYGPSPLKGIETMSYSDDFGKPIESGFTDDALPLDSQTEEIVRDFMEYCKAEGINVMFVKFPLVLREKEPDEIDVNLRANRVLEIAGEYGFPALNMQKVFYDIGLEAETDFYNPGHANTRGQRKITAYLCEFMKKECGIGPSELDKSTKEEWDRSITYYYALDQLSEALMKQGREEAMGESPVTKEALDRIIAGEDPDAVAKDYNEPYPLSRAQTDAKGAG